MIGNGRRFQTCIPIGTPFSNGWRRRNSSVLSDYLVSWSGRSGRLSPKVTVWGKNGTPADVVGHYVAQLLKGLVNERRIFVAAD